MNKLKVILAVLLAFQLVVIGVTWRDEHQPAPTKTLVNATLADVDRIEISDAKQTVSLVKQDDKWQLPQYHQLPVNQQQLSQLVAQFNQWRVSWPVATTDSSHQRFKVAPASFERHVIMWRNDQKVADFYLGTSPGFRKMHGRLADSNEVYALDIGSYQLPTTNIDWVDKKLLALNNIKQVELPSVSLTLANDQWQLEPAVVTMVSDVKLADKKISQDNINSYINDWKTLTVLEVVDKPLDKPTTTITVTTDDGKQYQYQWQKTDDAYCVKRNDIPVVFSVSAFTFEQLATPKVEQFYQEDGSAETQTESSSNSTHDEATTKAVTNQ
jgi:hypothetical protein